MNTSAEIAPNVQTIIWDLDGTLLDSFGIYRDCLNDVLRERGMPTASEELVRNNHHGHIEESVASVLRELGQDVSEAELAKLLDEFYVLDNAYIKDVDHHLFEDAVDLARRAHAASKRQIVSTNRFHGTDRGNGSPRSIVANSRLREFVSDVLCGDDSAFHKPDRAFLEARFGADLAELGDTIVIGDQFVDAQFARNIGCAAILVTRVDKIAHLDQLGDWENDVRIVPSLRDVKV